MEAPKELWLRYKKTPTIQLRDQIVEYYQDVLEAAAIYSMKRLPEEAFVEFDQLVNIGWMAMVAAMDKYELDRGVKFAAYCVRRVRGEILDELRDMDWVPRLTRNYIRQREKIEEKCLQQHNRLPTDEEVRRKSGLTKKKYMKRTAYNRKVMNASLSRHMFITDNGKWLTAIDLLADSRAISPALPAMKRSLKEVLTVGFSRSDKLIVSLYCYENMTMKEIGKTLEISESRVSQKFKSIIDRIKGRLGLPKSLKINDFFLDRS